MQLAEAHRTLSALAVGLHEVRKHRIGEQRHMAENVVEDVRFLQIVELGFRADEGPCGESAIRQMVEENLVRHQFGDRHDTPAGDLFQPVGEPPHMGDAGRGQFQLRHRLQRRGAGPAFGDLLLAAEQPVPPVMLLCAVTVPCLVDGEIGRPRGICVAVLLCRRGHGRIIIKPKYSFK